MTMIFQFFIFNFQFAHVALDKDDLILAGGHALTRDRQHRRRAIQPQHLPAVVGQNDR
jgi:hypothetical protein